MLQYNPMLLLLLYFGFSVWGIQNVDICILFNALNDTNILLNLHSLCLCLVERVNLLSHVGDGGVVLLPEGGQGGLVADVAAIQVGLELDQQLRHARLLFDRDRTKPSQIQK